MLTSTCVAWNVYKTLLKPQHFIGCSRMGQMSSKKQTEMFKEIFRKHFVVALLQQIKRYVKRAQSYHPQEQLNLLKKCINLCKLINALFA